MNMQEYQEQLSNYRKHLRQEERSQATIAQYSRDVCCFLNWSAGKPDQKETVIAYKAYLQSQYQATTVNAKLAAVNRFLYFVGRGDCRVKQLRIQRQAYCSQDRELTKEDYRRLVEASRKKKNEKLALVLQTICATGIRVSELRFITVEAVDCGQAAIHLKGKNRMVLLPSKLRRVLREYIQRQHRSCGPVFVTRTGNPIDRSNIWKAMKALCQDARVDPQKVFPHNLRHLFARCFYSIDKDIAKLADILGHSSIDTTRIYIISSGEEHRRRMDEVELVE